MGGTGRNCFLNAALPFCSTLSSCSAEVSCTAEVSCHAFCLCVLLMHTSCRMCFIFSRVVVLDSMRSFASLLMIAPLRSTRSQTFLENQNSIFRAGDLVVLSGAFVQSHPLHHHEDWQCPMCTLVQLTTALRVNKFSREPPALEALPEIVAGTITDHDQ